MNGHECKRMWKKDIENIINGNVIALSENEGVLYLRQTSKKLYKYYSLDSKYTWNNLENNVIYLSDPREFNDPFDCNIGLSVNDLIKEATLCAVAETNGNIEIRTFRQILKKLSKDTVDIKNRDEIIEKICEYPDVRNLVNRFRSEEDITDIEIMRVIYNNYKILPIICSLGIDNMTQYEKLIGELVEKSFIHLHNIFGENPSDENIKSICDFYDDVNKIGYTDSIIKYAQIFKIELSSLEGIMNEINNVNKKICEGIGRAARVSCFSLFPDNKLMWAHYANNNKGICVEYDFALLDKNIESALLLPVAYTKKRPVASAELIFDMMVYKGANRYLKRLMSEFIEMMLIKEDCWKYEEEWRYIDFKGDESNREIYLPIISKIIVGTKISEQDMKKVNEFAGKRGITIQKCKMQMDNYTFIIDNIY